MPPAAYILRFEFKNLIDENSLYVYFFKCNNVYLTSETFQHSKHTKKKKRTLQISFITEGSWTFIGAVALGFADNEELYGFFKEKQFKTTALQLKRIQNTSHAN